MDADQLKLQEWSKETIDCYLGEVNRVGENIATSFYNQSDLSRVRDCKLMIIGINPGAGCPFSQWELKNCITPNFLYKGNPCFRGMSNDAIFYEMSKRYDKNKRRYGWDIWKKIYKMLNSSNRGDVLNHLDEFVLTNMIFFGTAKEGQIPKDVDLNKCAQQTLKLIDILSPKIILLLGVKCKSLFEAVSNTKLVELETNNLSYCKRNESFVFAIKHTAHFYSNTKMSEIGQTICYALDYPETFEEKKEMIHLKHLIESLDSIQRIDDNGRLIHTYWCNCNGKYEEEFGTISISLEYDGHNYILTILTKGNHPDKLVALVRDFCKLKRIFIKDNSNDASFIAEAKTEKGIIVEFMNGLLAKIKAYRETDYPE